VSNLPAKHDAFLTALIIAPVTKKPMSRLLLVRELRKGTGQNLRESNAIVKEYCDRYGVFPLRKGLRFSLCFLPSLVYLALVAELMAYNRVLEKGIAAAPTRATHNLLLLEQTQRELPLLGLILVITITLSAVACGILWALARRDAEEARVILLRLLESH
jgi:hypothetical protein